MIRSPKANVAYLYVIHAGRWFLMIMPILFKFYQANRISMTEIFILQAVASLSSVLMEIPSGYFSDRLGRRKTLIIASVFSFAGFLIYSLSGSFALFLAAEICMGIGMSFVSGTDVALLYDSLIETGEVPRFKKLNVTYHSLGNFSEAGASIFGALLATVSLRLPFYVETAIVGLTIPLTILLVETNAAKKEEHHFSAGDLFSILKHTVIEHKDLQILVFLAATLGSATLVATWFVQPFWKAVNLPLVWYGVLWAAFNLSIGLFSLLTNRLEKKLGPNATVFSLTVLAVAVFAVMAFFQALWAVPFLILIYFIRGIQNPLFNDYINRFVTSDKRATVISIQSMLFRLEFVALSPLMGLLTDKISMKFALASAGLVYLAAFAVMIPILYRRSPVKA